MFVLVVGVEVEVEAVGIVRAAMATWASKRAGDRAFARGGDLPPRRVEAFS